MRAAASQFVFLMFVLQTAARRLRKQQRKWLSSAMGSDILQQTTPKSLYLCGSSVFDFCGASMHVGLFLKGASPGRPWFLISRRLTIRLLFQSVKNKLGVATVLRGTTSWYTRSKNWFTFFRSNACSDVLERGIRTSPDYNELR